VVFTPLCLRVALHNAFSACRLDDVQLCVDRGARNSRPVPVLELGSWTGLSHQRSPQARAWSGATRTRAREWHRFTWWCVSLTFRAHFRAALWLPRPPSEGCPVACRTGVHGRAS